MSGNKYVGLEALQTFLNNLKNTFVDKQSFDNTTEVKKDKDLIVTYQNGSMLDVTHSSKQILDAVNNGQTVKFRKDTELLNLLEITTDYATFYMLYVNMNGKLQQRIVVVSGSSVMLEQDDTYDYATIVQLNSKADKTELNNYYTKIQTEAYVDEQVDALNEKINNIDFPVTSVNGQTGDVVIDVQSDWNENQEDSPAYVKNRTHYISTTRVISLPEQVFDTGSNGYVDLYDVELTGLTPNCDCIVTINGAEYRTTAIHNTYNAYEWYIIGNGDLLGEDNGDTTMPFGFFVDKYNENWGQLDGISGDVTLKIEVFSEVVQKIPEIFLPDRVGLAGSGTYSEIFNNLTKNKASGDYAHAENFETEASGYSSHAEGLKTRASGYGSHSEGNDCEAVGSYSHAEGWDTLASGAGSHSAGIGTIAKGEGQTVVGKYNVEDNGSLFVVGCGTANTSRKNALTVNSAGKVECTGDIVCNGHSSSATPISLADIGNRTNLLETALSEIEDISSEDIQSLFA